ncbi:MAG: hypothetical protein ABI855_13235, partial [Bacteroidota bacterium]
TESIVRFYRMTNENYKKYSVDARAHVEENFDAVKNSASLKNIYLEYLNKFAMTAIALISF